MKKIIPKTWSSFSFTDPGIQLLIVPVFMLLVIPVSRSQTNLEIQAVYSPSVSKLSDDIFYFRFFNSFGIDAQLTSKSNFIVSGGVYWRKFGASFELPPDILHPRSYEVSYITSSLSIPIHAGYYFVSSNSFRLGIKLGVENCFLLDQKGKRPEKESDIGIYKNYLIAFVPKLAIGFKLDGNVQLILEPFWFKQLNENNSPFKEVAYGVNFGLGFPVH